MLSRGGLRCVDTGRWVLAANNRGSIAQELEPHALTYAKSFFGAPDNRSGTGKALRQMARQTAR
jgi:hypothetical protein